MQIGKIVVIEPTDMVILKAVCCMRKEDMEAEERYLKDRWGIDVKIVDSRYEIAGIETNG